MVLRRTGVRSECRARGAKALTTIYVARRRRQRNDDGDRPLESKTGEGRVERLVGTEKFGEGIDAFSPKLLVDPTLRELRHG
jgi:hypothetical protein